MSILDASLRRNWDALGYGSMCGTSFQEVRLKGVCGIGNSPGGVRLCGICGCPAERVR